MLVMEDIPEETKLNSGRVIEREIEQELKDSFLDYAMSVIVSRALPDVKDGLKPVHRRILYAMNELGVFNNKPYVKSARIVGDCMGKFHPHGDLSIYDALVRMAQDFSLRYMLIQGQGNFGCFTGDTKVKLADGRDLSFIDLIKEHKEGKRNYTFTANSEGMIEIAEIKSPRLTKRNQKIMKVILDNNEEIKCTLNHKFMMRNGKYKEAQKLKSEDSLMPLYIRSSTEKDSKPALAGYNMILQPENVAINHKVSKVEFTDQIEDVYDLTIENTHNFALASGVFVHNSIDGDPAAAMRYSEARLQKIAEDMLEDLNKETVDFGDNYDGKLKEPLFLPAKVPNLLINGSSGIAVGMATNILPHNLKETCDAIVHMIDSPNATINELLNLMKGPDLPTAGIICGTSGIKSYFKTGRGKVIVKSKIDVEEKGNKTYLIVREIPYMVNKSEMIEQIADAVKDGKIEGISDIKDESSRQGMRIVFALKSNANTDVTLNQLFKHSRLKESYGVNIVALVNNQPRTLNIRELIEYFIMHRKEVVTKRAKFDLREAEDKAHKLEGLKIALDHIDAVVALIKASKSPEEATLGLMKNFKLTEIQAKTILDMRLQRLTGLEQEKIRMDLKETLKLIEELKKLLSSVKLILGVVKKETLELKEKYGDERRTLITSEEDGEIQVEDLIEEAQTVITITHTGYIKRLPLDTYKSQKRGGKGVRGTATKDEDFVEDIYTASTHDHLLLFTNFGKLHWIKVHEIPEASRTSKGKAIINLIPLSEGEKVTAIVPVAKFDPNLNLIGATKQGTVKKTSLDEYSNPRKGGIAAITLEEGDELVAVALTTGNDEIMLGTAQGNAVRFNEKDARPIGRTGKGVRGVRLDDKDEVIGMIIAQKGIDILTITENGYGKRSSIDEYRLTARGGKGVINIKTSERNGNVVSIRAVTDKDEVMFISKNGIVIRTPAKDISQIGRNTQGLRLMRLEEGDKVVSMTKVVEENGVE